MKDSICVYGMWGDEVWLSGVWENQTWNQRSWDFDLDNKENLSSDLLCDYLTGYNNINESENWNQLLRKYHYYKSFKKIV